MFHFKKTNFLYITIPTIFSILSFIFSPLSFAYENELFQYEDIEQIAPNTTHHTIYKMTDVGWIKINIIKANLDNQYINSTVLIPDSISQKKTLSELAMSEKNIVAAINGDFFDTTGHSTLGIVVKDGKYITSSIHDNRFFNYIHLKDGRSFISKIKGSSTKLNNSKSSVSIKYKNKPYLAFDRAIIFDRYWGDKSIGNTCSEPVVELVIEDNIIKEIRNNQPPIKLPENGYVVSAVGTARENILTNFSISDRVSISGESFLESIEDAIGGGARILYNGQPVEDFSLNILGRHPRSALGFSKDNKTLYLLTIDGRHKNYTGMTQTELAYLMLHMGAYTAINLDGGGSSEMVVRSASNGFNIVNTPSDGKERPIHNAIGIVNNAPLGKASHIKLSVDKNQTFINIPIKVNCQIFDQNGHILNINPNEIKWSVKGTPYNQNENTFTFHNGGVATIETYFKDIKASIDIKILDNLTSIEANPKQASLDINEPLKISLTGKDNNGYCAPIPLDIVHKTYTGLTGKFDNDIFTATSSGQGLLTFSFGQAMTQIPIGVGSTNISIYDFEQNKGNFASYPPATVSGYYSEMDFSYNNSKSGIINYDFTKDTATRAAYVKFENSEIPLPNNTSSLTLNVFGNYGQNHQLRAKFEDINGKVHTIDFAKDINWTNWTEVSANIPKGISPAFLKSIYIVETNPTKQDKGAIAFDDLSANIKLVPTKIKQNNNEQYHLSNVNLDEVDIAMISTYFTNDNNDSPEIIPNIIGEPYLKIPEKSKSVQNIDCANKKIIYNKNKLEPIFLKNDKGFLSRTNINTGWHKLLSYRDHKYDKPIVILLEMSPWFKNPLDTRLFYETLDNINENGNKVILIYPDGKNIITKDNGITHIKYNSKDNLNYIFDIDNIPILVNTVK